MLPTTEVLTLSDLEMGVAEMVGGERARYAEERAYKSRFPEGGKRTGTRDNHILGVMAELAIARYVRLPWIPNIGTIEGIDVGVDVEVRCRRIRDPRQAERGQGIAAGLLSLNRKDRDKGDKAFVIVHRYADAPDNVLHAVGWRMGWDVMQDKYWQQDPDMPDGTYRLPHDQLRHMERLHDFLEFRREQRWDDSLADIIRKRDAARQ